MDKKKAIFIDIYFHTKPWQDRNELQYEINTTTNARLACNAYNKPL